MARGLPASLRVFGLTGGMGTGKSTVAKMFATRGVPVLDADQLAREVAVPGGLAYADIAAAWPEVLDPTGAIDRKRLGALVFADPVARKRLESLIHPRIMQAAAARLTDIAAAGHTLTLYEAALLVETGRYRDFDGLIVVTASPETQIARATARNNLSRPEAEARIRAQLPTFEKVRVATHLIENDGAISETEAQVDRLLIELRRPP